MRTRRVVAGVIACLTAVVALAARSGAPQADARLSDSAFAELVQSLSEKDGWFVTENFVSNERRLQTVLAPLTERVAPGGVYLGVGPEQNFTFINALHPSLAFIVDIRRQNLVEHLFYKMAFESSPTRADFLSYIFSRARPPDLGADTDITTMFRAYLNVHPALSLRTDHLKAATATLRTRFSPMFTKGDEGTLRHIFEVFFDGGPLLTYLGDIRAPKSGAGVMDRFWPTLATVMTATDDQGRQAGYLASEGNYRYVKDVEARNLIVPVVGNFGGPKAIRAVGDYVRRSGRTVTAFYLSNVEQYLFQGGPWKKFYDNVATLPLDETSTFIRFWAPVLSPDAPERLSPMQEFLKGYRAGDIKRWEDLGKYSR